MSYCTFIIEYPSCNVNLPMKLPQLHELENLRHPDNHQFGYGGGGAAGEG